MNHFFEWLDMGGYSLYVWPAYALVSLVLVLNVLVLKRQRNRTERILKQWFKN